MMEHVARGLYCSPKCGLSFIQQLSLGKRATPSEPVLFVRNPYSRLVSYYVNKVVYYALEYDPDDDDPDYANMTPAQVMIKRTHRTRRRTPSDGSYLYSVLGLSDTAHGIETWSFRQFVEWLVKQEATTIERHLLPQHTLPEGTALPAGDHRPRIIFKIEELFLPETQERFGDIFNIGPQHGDRADRVQEILYKLKHGEGSRKINKTPRTKGCDRDVYNMTPSQMRETKNIPSCVNRYYNEEIASKVYNYYKQDFELYSYIKETP